MFPKHLCAQSSTVRRSCVDY